MQRTFNLYFTLVIVSLLLLPVSSIADSARVAGDLKVDGIHFTGDNSVVRKLADLISPWTLLTGNLYYIGGNVGIGTMTPGAPLDVNGSAIVSGSLAAGALSTSGQITSTVATGTPPLAIFSTTMVPNLNAEMIGGLKSSDLDNRYYFRSTPVATSQQISTIRWDQVAQKNMFQVGQNPAALVFDGTHIWVANSGGNTVHKINVKTGDVSLPITVGTAPYALAFDGANIWVANAASNTIQSIDVNGIVSAPITVGTNPKALAFDGTSIWVACKDSSQLVKYNPATGNLSIISTNSNPIALKFDGNFMWVVNWGSGTVQKFDLNGNLAATINVDPNPTSITYSAVSFGSVQQITPSRE